jgi:hypothetical protein
MSGQDCGEGAWYLQEWRKGYNGPAGWVMGDHLNVIHTKYFIIRRTLPKRELLDTLVEGRISSWVHPRYRARQGL